MNVRPVQQALGILLPALATDLPPELLSLAESLVAQSRSYATSLKPEEEIARPHACAEIACKRLSRALSLPPLLGRPPCPPRVYKKLYSFLDRSLVRSTVSTKRPATSFALGTPTRASFDPVTPTKGGQLSSRIRTEKTPQETPTKSNPLKRTSTKPQSLSLKSSTRDADRNAGNSMIKDAPQWVMSSIRAVCKALATKAPPLSGWSQPAISKTFPPHMFAGVSSILHFIGTTPDEELDERSLELLGRLHPAGDVESQQCKELVVSLIIAVYFVVLARCRGSRQRPRRNAESSPNGDRDKLDKKALTEMRHAAFKSAGFSTMGLRQHCDDVDTWTALIMNQGWAKGREWFKNIPGVEANDAAEDSSDASDTSDGSDRDSAGPKRRRKNPGSISRDSLLHSIYDTSPRGGLLPGLGTMMQNRIDWLSEERREDYRDWKAGIMRQITGMERKAKSTRAAVGATSTW